MGGLFDIMTSSVVITTKNRKEELLKAAEPPIAEGCPVAYPEDSTGER